MTRRYSLPAPPPPPSKTVAERLRAHLRRSWPGRVLLASLALFALHRVGVPLPRPLPELAAFLLILFCLVHGSRLLGFLLHRLLWRIRTKLIVSYLFIAVVPVVLLALFFLIAG